MLPAQVSYWNLQEVKRHNQQTEDLGFKTLFETSRHNKVTEAETQRHDLATELYYTNSLLETSQHNRATERLGEESNAINKINAFTNQRNAAANEMNAATNRWAAEQKANVDKFNAVTGYSLGLDAQRIADKNAETNAKNAETRWLEWTTGTGKLSVESQNADTNALNAQTNVLNAESNARNAATNEQNAVTRQQEVQLGYDNLNFNKEKFDWQMWTDSWDTFFRGLDSSTNAYKNVFGKTNNSGH